MSNCKDEVRNGRFVPEFTVSALKETISKLFSFKSFNRVYATRSAVLMQF